MRSGGAKGSDRERTTRNGGWDFKLSHYPGGNSPVQPSRGCRATASKDARDDACARVAVQGVVPIQPGRPRRPSPRNCRSCDRRWGSSRTRSDPPARHHLHLHFLRAPGDAGEMLESDSRRETESRSAASSSRTLSRSLPTGTAPARQPCAGAATDNAVPTGHSPSQTNPDSLASAPSAGPTFAVTMSSNSCGC